MLIFLSIRLRNRF